MNRLLIIVMRGLLICICLVGSFSYGAKEPVRQQISIPSSCYLNRKTPKLKRPQCYGHDAAALFGSLVEDVICLNLNLISWDSFKIISSLFPFYISTRIIDEKLQNCFYEARCHKNKNQMPSWCHEVAEWSIALPIIFLGQNAFFSKDPDLQMTSRIFLLGMPFMIWTKDLTKKFEFDACWRPWNEHFSCQKRAKGGFPSGHMAQATFAAVLYGMRFGYKYAIPLTGLAAFVGTTFLTCNRHYVSQIIAGAGFGALYAVAASKLVDERLSEQVQFSCSVNRNGCPTAKVSCRF